MGCSIQSVPSWSKVATRSSGGTKSARSPGRVGIAASAPSTRRRLMPLEREYGTRTLLFGTFPFFKPWLLSTGDPRGAPVFFRSDPRLARSVAGAGCARRMILLLCVDLFHHLGQVPRGRGLHRRVRFVGLQMLQGQLLADRQYVPVIDVRGDWSGQRAAERVEALGAHGLLERVALEVDQH